MPANKPSSFLQQLYKAAKSPAASPNTSLPATSSHQPAVAWGNQVSRTKEAMSPQEQDAWNRMLSMLLVGGGAGAGARGLIGLRDMFRKRPAVDAQSTIPETIPIIVPQKTKAAEDGILGARADGGMNYWEYPMGMAAGAGGLMGGWKLMDWLMDKRRKASMQSELSRAQQAYQQALQDDVNAASVVKAASADDSLDAVYAHLQDAEKMASHFSCLAASGALDWLLEKRGNTLATALHGAGGAYLTALLLAGGLSGMTVYNRTRAAQENEDANRRRRLTRTGPQPIMAVPANA